MEYLAVNFAPTEHIETHCADPGHGSEEMKMLWCYYTLQNERQSQAQSFCSF